MKGERSIARPSRAGVLATLAATAVGARLEAARAFGSPPWGEPAGAAFSPARLLAEGSTLVSRSAPLLLLPLLAGILLLAVVFLYRRDRGCVSAARGRVLTALRAATVVGLLVLLFDPASRRVLQKRHRPELLVAIDVSASMGLGAPGARRIDRVRDALLGGWLDELARGRRLRIVTLADRTIPLTAAVESRSELAAARVRLRALDATGDATDLGRPLLEEVLRHPFDPPDAILLLSDGRHHAASDPAEAARELGRRGVPVVAIDAGDVAPPAGPRLRVLASPGRVLAGDPVEIDLEVDLPGTAPGRLLARGRVGDAPPRETSLEAPEGGGAVRTRLRLPSGSPGLERVEVSVRAPDAERASEAATRRVPVEVLPGEVRVAWLDRGPRWELRYVRSLWQKDERVKLDVHRLPPPPEHSLPPGFPHDAGELEAIDVLVLGDVDAALLSCDHQEAIRRHVLERGATLVVIAGDRWTPRTWRQGPLADLLPLRPPPSLPPRDLAARLARSGARLRLEPAGEASRCCRFLCGREENIELWGLLPPPQWFWPSPGARPGAEVLVSLVLRSPPAEGREAIPPPVEPEEAGADGGTSEVRVPLVARRPAGAGEVVWLGFDSTWRWRLGVGDAFLRRFWGALARKARLDRLVPPEGPARIGTDRFAYEATDQIRIDAVLAAPPGASAAPGLADAVITRAGSRPPGMPGGRAASRRVPLRPIPGSGGRLRATLEARRLGPILAPATASSGDPTAEGGSRGPKGSEGSEGSEGSGDSSEFVDCEIRLDSAGSSAGASRPPSPRARIRVRRPGALERLDFHSAPRLLDEIARRSGGSSLPLERRAEALGRLPARGHARPESEEVALRDHPLVIVATLITLLGLEWLLRKRWNLV